ncbi:MAG: VTT domain-containing protein [Candidatus Lokiarchaeota archaeon]|nr:VTT domain-containing protein [Candidatus Lokiarchaeota archaeon]
MKLKRIDYIFIVILLILTVITVDFALFEGHRALITNIWDIDGYKSEDIAVKLGIVFFVCLVGNLLPVPTPYTWSVCLGIAYIVVSPFHPLLFGFVASLGCLGGELVGYFLGRGASEIISDERKENLKNFQKYMVDHPSLAPILIFLFGATPLNDDFLTIPLGLLKYDLKKTILFCWLGKLVLMLIFAYNVLNLCDLIGGENWVLSLASLYLIVIMVYVMLRVNLSEVLGKILKKKNL